MSVTHGKMGLSLTQEILSHLGLANKVRAAGIVGIIFKNYFYINAEAGGGGGAVRSRKS